MAITHKGWEVLFGKVLLSEKEPIRTTVNNRDGQYTTGEIVFNFSDDCSLHLIHKDIRMITEVDGIPYFNNEMLYYKTLLDVTEYTETYYDKLILTFTDGVTLNLRYDELEIIIRDPLETYNVAKYTIGSR